MSSSISERVARRRDLADSADLASLILKVLPQFGRLATSLHGSSLPSLARSRVLLQLRHRPMRVGELARSCMLTAPAVTALVDSLVRDGHVRRTDDPADRRVVIVGLTERGRAETKRVRDRFADTLSRVLGDLTPAERARLLRAFADLDAALARALDEPEVLNGR